MSRNALGGALRDIQKTTARETILGGTSLVEVEVPQAPLQPPEPESRILPGALRDSLLSGREGDQRYPAYQQNYYFKYINTWFRNISFNSSY